MEQKERNDRREATPAQQFQYQTAEPAKAYCFPPVTMLAVSPHGNPVQETEELQTNGRILVDTLKSFGVQTKILDICRGPSVTRYEIQPAAGVKISKITNLSDDLALNLAATGVRIEAPIPGKAAVGIEVPNKSRSTVRMGTDRVQLLPVLQKQVVRSLGPGYRRAGRHRGPGQNAPSAYRRHHRFWQIRVYQLPHRQHALQGQPR